MRKKIPQRILSLILASLMILSIASCGNPATPATSATATPAASVTATDAATPVASVESTATATAEAANDPFAPYPETVTLTWAFQTSAAAKLLDGETVEDNRWTRLLKEKLNIDLKLAFVADSSTDAYTTKLNAIIASGDLPDIFKTQDMNVFLGLVDAGSLADLTQAREQYQSPEVKGFLNQYKEAVDGATFDGKLMAIPRANDNFHEAPFLWIRDDWLANTGMKAPTTVEEMVALAKVFATGDPDKNGVKGDTYGLALNKDLIRQNHGSILGLVSAFGVPGRDESQFYRDDAGKMAFAWIQPAMKPALTVLAQMYKDGLINKEFTAKNESALVEDITNGKIGMAYGSNWGLWYPYNNVYKKDGVIVHPYAIPTETGYKYKVGVESNATGQMTCVSSRAKNPEAAIKILNLYMNVVNESPENFDKYWSNEQYRLCPVYTDVASENWFREINDVLNGKKDASTLSKGAIPNYKFVTGFEDGTNKDDNALGTWGQMAKTGSLQWIVNKYEPDGAMSVSLLGMKRPEIWTTNVSILDTLTITTFTDIIIGAKPVDSFDAFVTAWLAGGGQQTLDEMDKLYPAK